MVSGGATQAVTALGLTGLIVLLSAASARAEPEAPSQRESLSIGTCEDGHLVGGIELPARAEGLRRLSIVGQRGTGFATNRMVAFVERTARRLAELPDHRSVPLRVGNLSARGGGRIRWSHSHRSGRDVDLVFYARGRRGRPRSPDRFLHYDDSGHARWRRRRYSFDAGRNWNLVKTLLTDPTVHPARLYIAEPLRRMVLARARELGEAEWLLQRATHVLVEPTFAGTHDDHLHVRIYCSREEILAGCVDEDPLWPWVPDYRRARRRRIEEAVAALGSPEPAARWRAIATLGPLHAADREGTEALAWAAAHDSSAALRRLALRELRNGGSHWAFPALTAAAARLHACWRAFDLLAAAIATAAPDDAPGLLGLLDSERTPYRHLLSIEQFSVLRRLVARQLRPWLLEEGVRPMLRVLDDPSPTTRRAALRTLEYVANRRFAAPRQARTWYAASAGFGRLHWMYEGFFRAGVPVEAPPQVLAPRLIDLLRGPDEVLARNAEALLTRVTGGVTLHYVATPPRRHRAWRRWWRLHHERYEWLHHGGSRQDPIARRLSASVPSS